MERIPEIFIDQQMYHAQAVAHYTQVLEAEPEVRDAYFFRARHYSALGEHEQAAQDLRQWGGEQAPAPAPLPGAQQWERVVAQLQQWMGQWGAPSEQPADPDALGVVPNPALQQAFEHCGQGEYQLAIDAIWAVMGEHAMDCLDWAQFAGALRLDAYCSKQLHDWDTARLRCEASLLQECMRREQYRYGRVLSEQDGLFSADDVHNDYRVFADGWEAPLPQLEALRALTPGTAMAHPCLGVALSYLCLSELHRLLGNPYGAVVSRLRAAMAAAER